MLEINDAVVSRLASPGVTGTVRLGTPNDFEVSFLPILLSRFAKTYPDVTLNVVSDLSINLREQYKKGAFDLVLSMDEHPNHNFREGDYIVEKLSWVAGYDYTLKENQPVDLVLYPQGCIYRKYITQVLNSHNIPWRVLYCSSSLLGIQTAIKAGLGVSALAINTIPSKLQTSEELCGLPKLGKITIGFNYDQPTLSSAAALLLEWVRTGLKQNQSYPSTFKIKE